jgi:hypothetical protein
MNPVGSSMFLMLLSNCTVPGPSSRSWEGTISRIALLSVKLGGTITEIN